VVLLVVLSLLHRSRRCSILAKDSRSSTVVVACKSVTIPGTRVCN